MIQASMRLILLLTSLIYWPLALANDVIIEPNSDQQYLALSQELADLRSQAHTALDSINAPQWQVDSISADEFAQANALMQHLAQAQAERVALFAHLSPQLQSQLSGFTPEGLRRISAEVEHLMLMARWYPTQRLYQLRHNVSHMADVFQASYLGLLLVQFALLIWSLRWVHRKTPAVIQYARQWLSEQRLSAERALAVEQLFITITSLRRELLLLLGVYLSCEWLLASRQGITEWYVGMQLAYTYAWFMLGLATLHRIVLQALSRYTAIDAALNAKIHNSLRLVIRLAMLVNVYLILAHALLGRGALYGIAENVAILGALAVAWRLIHQWRREVTQTYLRLYPDGRLAELVRKHQDRVHGLALVALAFVFVAALGIWVWLRDTTLRFENTRKALAYLFRRQLERHAISETAERDTDELPQTLRALFSDDGEGAQLLDYFPKLTAALAQVTELTHGRGGGLIAVSGERGSGKTTWLHELRHKIPDQIDSDLITVEQRLTQPAELLAMLADQLGVNAETEQDCIHALNSGEYRVVMIDLAQNLMLRDVGGMQAYEALLKIAQASYRKVLWVLSFAEHAFHYLQFSYPDRDIYDLHITLPAWSEQRIGELINVRLQQAGYIANYDGLVSHAMLQQDLHNETPSHDGVASRYMRLIWDYAGGNPRLALHFYLQSLVWVGSNMLRVKLFPVPTLTALEQFSDQTHYILSCLMVHENITADEAARSLRLPRHECARALSLLSEQGYLWANEQQRYRVETHWHRAILRFLQRKKMLDA